MVARRREGERGQSLVEFSLAITVFLVLLMGVVDLGRAVYQLNSVTEAARDLARVASVHPGSALGTSDESVAATDAQAGLVPNLEAPSYTCIDLAGNAVSGSCEPGDWVQVTVASTFIPVTPIASFLGEIVLSGSAGAKIE